MVGGWVGVVGWGGVGGGGGRGVGGGGWGEGVGVGGVGGGWGGWVVGGGGGVVVDRATGRGGRGRECGYRRRPGGINHYHPRCSHAMHVSIGFSRQFK